MSVPVQNGLAEGISFIIIIVLPVHPSLSNSDLKFCESRDLGSPFDNFSSTSL
jgi:hypothetical protein